MLGKLKTVMVLTAITFTLHVAHVEGLFDRNLRGSFQQPNDVGEYQTKTEEGKGVAESEPISGTKSAVESETMPAPMSALEFGVKNAEANSVAESVAKSAAESETMSEPKSGEKNPGCSGGEGKAGCSDGAKHSYSISGDLGDTRGPGGVA